ncbi:uncharacterized protein [Haliotis asinina]|uniref:uncharacterized protein n=1 Tax=Haliotis asinina TaxID=109174 RepID=UPI00353239D6
MVILRCLVLLAIHCLLSTPGTGANIASKSNDVTMSSSKDDRQPDIVPDEHSRMPFHRVIRSPKGLLRKVKKTVKTRFLKNTPGSSQYKKATDAGKLFISKLPNSANKAKVQNIVSNLFRSAKAGSVLARKSLKSLLPNLLGFGAAGAGLATAITQLLAVTRDQPQLPSESPFLLGEMQSLMHELGGVKLGTAEDMKSVIEEGPNVDRKI